LTTSLISNNHNVALLTLGCELGDSILGVSGDESVDTSTKSLIGRNGNDEGPLWEILIGDIGRFLDDNSLFAEGIGPLVERDGKSETSLISLKLSRETIFMEAVILLIFLVD